MSKRKYTVHHEDGDEFGSCIVSGAGARAAAEAMVEAHHDIWSDGDEFDDNVTVCVRSPDGTWTKHVVHLVVERREEAFADEGVPCEDPAVENRRILAEIARDIPESAWFTIDGHRWATDGWVLVREDGPRPDIGRDTGWSTNVGHAIIEAATKMLGQVEDGISPYAFSADRLATMLRANGPAVATSISGGAGAIVRDGEVVAIMMRMRTADEFGSNGPPLVDAYGNPWAWGPSR